MEHRESFTKRRGLISRKPRQEINHLYPTKDLPRKLFSGACLPWKQEREKFIFLKELLKTDLLKYII